MLLVVVVIADGDDGDDQGRDNDDDGHSDNPAVSPADSPERMRSFSALTSSLFRPLEYL